MDAKIRGLIEQYVHDNIDKFHQKRLEGIKSLKLKTVLMNKNPYLFRDRNLNSASDLVTALLDARLSSSEEGSFGGFLEDLALFVTSITGGGQKSSSDGLDIDLTRDNTRYLIAVKSGKNWGNQGQKRELRANFRKAVRVLKQSRNTLVTLAPSSPHLGFVMAGSRPLTMVSTCTLVVKVFGSCCRETVSSTLT